MTIDKHVIYQYSECRSIVLMVVQEGERNIFDQRGIEDHLLLKYGITVVRKTLTEINLQCRMEVDHSLYLYFLYCASLF